jgi:hypothetical protein
MQQGRPGKVRQGQGCQGRQVKNGREMQAEQGRARQAL